VRAQPLHLNVVSTQAQLLHLNVVSTQLHTPKLAILNHIP